MEKRVVGEDVRAAYKVFIVALPETPHDEFLSVSVEAPLCWSGTLYYSDNSAESFDAYETEMSFLTPEWARLYIPGYENGMKLLPVPAFYHSSFDFEKSNAKLQKKLGKMTRWEFYNSKW